MDDFNYSDTMPSLGPVFDLDDGTPKIGRPAKDDPTDPDHIVCIVRKCKRHYIRFNGLKLRLRRKDAMALADEYSLGDSPVNAMVKDSELLFY